MNVYGCGMGMDPMTVQSGATSSTNTQRIVMRVPTPIHNTAHHYHNNNNTNNTHTTTTTTTTHPSSSSSTPMSVSGAAPVMRTPLTTNISEASYKETYWPTIVAMLTQILQYPTKPSRAEDLYSTVYRCQRHAALLFNDTTFLVKQYLVIVRDSLLNTAPTAFLETFARYYVAFDRSVQVISVGFKYLDKTYVHDKHSTSLQTILTNLFKDIILEHSTGALVKQKLKLSMQHITVTDPSLLMSLTKGLYSIDKDYAKCNPAIFALYIPCLRPSRGIDHDVHETMLYFHSAGAASNGSNSNNSNNSGNNSNGTGGPSSFATSLKKRKYETLLTT